MKKHIKCQKNKKYKKYTGILLGGAGLVLALAGCGEKNTEEIQQETETTVVEEETVVNPLEQSGAKGDIDFDALAQVNPEIFAWLYIPDTGIDCPVLQSGESDEYYQTHTAEGIEGDGGAVYTEMPNLMNMCDFNTILHGRDLQETEPFYGLHRFEDAEFFETHEQFYLYLPDNVLTYEIVAAYHDEGSDILRRYDYTSYSGCQEYLDALCSYRSMGKNMREGCEDLTPYHFLVTLDGCVQDDGTQYVVIGVLVGDAAGTIDRVVLE